MPLRPRARSSLSGYLVALLAVAAMAVIRESLDGVLGQTALFAPFVSVVMFSAWYGGLKPGLLATILSLVAIVTLFLPSPLFPLDLQEATGGGIFFFTGVMISWLCETLHGTRRRLIFERRKLRDTALRERARTQELEAILDAVPAEISIAHDPECRRITRSRGGGEEFDESRPEDQAMQRAARGVEVRGLEVEHASRGGTRHTLYGNVVPLRDANGLPCGSVGAFVDITELKRAESARQIGEARFRLLAQMIPSIVWIADPGGQVTYANDQWYEYSGLSPEDNVRDWPSLVLHPDDFERCRDHWARSLRTGIEFELEVRNRRHDGCYRWFLTRAAPLKDSRGRLVSWFGVTTDIHELKELQERMREDERRKDEFLATLAHELRNPLAPLRNSLEVMKRCQGDLALIEHARTMMERQLHHMVRMVDDLLDLSRMTRNRLELRRELVDLRQILDQVQAIECGHHQLTMKLPDEKILLHADPDRLAQVFSNLLNNACKFSERGSAIEIEATVESGALVVAVRDRGIGIDAPMLPRIFDMFTQADRTRGRKYDGLGIGLTLVKRIVEMHGGTIEAQSEGRGQGSEFVVRLPAESGEAFTHAVPQRAPEQQRRGCRILVVDDNLDSAESLAAVLRFMGNEVTTSHDGASAVDRIAESRPQMVLLDIGMPEVDGYETAKRIRRMPEGSKVVLVAVTGYGQEQDKSRSFAAGFDHHLVKPVDPTVLESLVGESATGAQATAS
jgi:two-component system CheB/CheR fusion protein